MNDKEKQTEILLLTEAIYESGHGLDWEDCKDIALQLNFLDYRKTPKGSVVLDRYDAQKYYAYKIIEPQIKGCLDRELALEKQLKEAHNQAVKDFVNDLIDLIHNETFRKGYELAKVESRAREIAKNKYGVKL